MLLKAYFTIQIQWWARKSGPYSVQVGQKKLLFEITVCHHSGSLMNPIGDQSDGFFYPTLTPMIHSYSMTRKCQNQTPRTIQQYH